MARWSSILYVCFTGVLVLAATGCADEPDAPADPLDDPWVDAIDDEPAAGEPAEAVAPAGAAAAAAPEEPGDAAEADAAVDAPEPNAVAAVDTPAEPGAVAKADAPAEGESNEKDDQSGKPAQPVAKAAPSGTRPSAKEAAEPSAAEPAEPAPKPNEGAAEAEAPADTPSDAAPAPAVAPAPAPEPPKPPEPAPFTVADFNGKYRYVGGEGQRKALEQAIEDAAEQLNVVIRKIGRKRLTETNPIDPSLEIIVTGDKVKTIFSKSGFDAECKIDGPTISYTNKKGKKLKVRVRRSKNRLVQSIADSDGVKTTVFVLSKDGKRLTVHHKVTADRLDSPMTYKLSFARK